MKPSLRRKTIKPYRDVIKRLLDVIASMDFSFGRGQPDNIATELDLATTQGRKLLTTGKVKKDE